MIIYGIELSEGQYEDYYTDIKKAFKSKEEAEAYVLKYNRILSLLKSFYTQKNDEFNSIEYNDEAADYYVKYWKYEDKHPCRIREIELI